MDSSISKEFKGKYCIESFNNKSWLENILIYTITYIYIYIYKLARNVIDDYLN